MFVVFEGPDKSGKTTLSKNVYDILNSTHKVNIIHFPDRNTQVGYLINKYLNGKIKIDPYTTHLLFTADRYQRKEFIENSSGSILLCDRYSWSGITCSYAKGIDINWCIETEKLLPKADLTFYLEIDIDILVQRKYFGDEVLERRDLQEKVQDGYFYMKEFENNVVCLDGTKPEIELAQECVKKIKECLGDRNQYIVN